MNVPDAQYRCMRCGFKWEGYRVLWDDKGNGHRYNQNGGRGMTECPSCKNIYVEWVNWEQVRVALGRYWER